MELEARRAQLLADLAALDLEAVRQELEDAGLVVMAGKGWGLHNPDGSPAIPAGLVATYVVFHQALGSRERELVYAGPDWAAAEAYLRVDNVWVDSYTVETWYDGQRQGSWTPNA